MREQITQPRATTLATPATPAASAVAPAQGPTNSGMAAAMNDPVVQEAVAAGVDPQDVVLYLTLNNTTHDKTELPEALSALKMAEQEGLGHRELLPVSDPYWSEPREGDVRYSDPSYAHSFGEDAKDRLQFWHGDDTLQPGQVRAGGDVLSLGTSSVDSSDPAAADRARADWRTALLTVGMSEGYADKVVQALLQDANGDFRRLASGDGATNELIQYAMAMYRSEIGEIDITDVVFSGHHYQGWEGAPTDYAQGIWGEIPGASASEAHYDDTLDFFGLLDVAALKVAFPKAYAKVKAVQFAACNTNRLGLDDGGGGVQTTDQFLQGSFENIEMASYWTTLAPIAAVGFETNGEFLLDSARQQDGNDAAARDARHNPAGLKRSLLDENGVLSPITMKTNRSSYAGDGINGLRGTSTKEFDERTDLADHVFTGETLPDQTKE